MGRNNHKGVFFVLVTWVFVAQWTLQSLVVPAAGLAIEAEKTGPLPTGGSAARIQKYIVVLKKNGPNAQDTSDCASRLLRKYGGTLLIVYRKALPGFVAALTEDQAAEIAADPSVKYVEQSKEVHGN
jgi:hypothetical protein